MPGICGYNCIELPQHVLADCGNYKRGGISAIGIVDCDSGIIDWSSESEWQSAITAGKAKIINQIKGNVPEASIVSGEAPTGCGPVEVFDGLDFTIEFKDFNVFNENNMFYDALSDRQVFVVVYMCETDDVLIYEVPTNCAANLVIPESNKEKAYYQVSCTGSSTGLPTLAVSPPNIFS